MASKAENVSIWWRHHVGSIPIFRYALWGSHVKTNSSTSYKIELYDPMNIYFILKYIYYIISLRIAAQSVYLYIEDRIIREMCSHDKIA